MPANRNTKLRPRYPSPFGMPEERLADDGGDGKQPKAPLYKEAEAFAHASEVVRAMAEATYLLM